MSSVDSASALPSSARVWTAMRTLLKSWTMPPANRPRASILSSWAKRRSRSPLSWRSTWQLRAVTARREKCLRKRDILFRPSSGFGINRAETADTFTRAQDQRNTGVGNDGKLNDSQIAIEPGIFPGIFHNEWFASRDRIAGKRNGSGASPEAGTTARSSQRHPRKHCRSSSTKLTRATGTLSARGRQLGQRV